MHDLTEKEYFAVIHRSEAKKTMRDQLEIIQFMQKVMKQSTKI